MGSSKIIVVWRSLPLLANSTNSLLRTLPTRLFETTQQLFQLDPEGTR